MRLANKAGSGKKLTPVEGKILRGQAPLLGITMIVGTYADLPSHTLNRTAAFYLVGRMLFNWLYLSTTTHWKSFFRTAVFNINLIALFRILVLATIKINQK
ncbi:hypothetical protein OC846_004928 [Tilletia horrida]|uniref:Uncharacterized protein n=1 Tax=Tilletia horrida TaxID=155126 RepID=A0AAN6JQQ1_9BASI|nr:hypothetical protein OC846_004928 [Tilletia horrida]KAK0563745.1 hypothetical protein OC861_004644 [Tilletia horrida]